MRKLTLPARSLAYYRQTHAAAVLAIAVAATILAGSLVVGDSMRAALRENAVARLGPVDHALVGRHFFTQSLADRIISDPSFRESFGQLCPAIVTAGSLKQADAEVRANRVSIIGVDELATRFWRTPEVALPDRHMAINRSLAERLGVKGGEDVLVRIPRYASIPPETLLGRRDRAYVSMRLTVASILADGGPGGFSLNPAGGPPLNAYVDLAALQRALRCPGKINALLVSEKRPRGAGANAALLASLVQSHARLADYGLAISESWIQSRTLFIPLPIENAVARTAKNAGIETSLVIIYLANSIALERSDTAEVPYSVVAAVDRIAGLALGADDIVLTDWAAEELNARAGDRVRLTYYQHEDTGGLTTESADFRVRAIVPLAQASRFRGAVPAYEGITDTKRISDWDPPFPLDLERIGSRDETYWEEHGPTPKAFVSLEAGRRLWTQHTRQHGEITSVELRPAQGRTEGKEATALADALLRNLSPEMAGLAFQPIRAHALQAARGSTDFGMLFVAFSFFLMIAAVLLVALIFRLHLERRSPQMGILLAGGFAPQSIARLLLVEGFVLAAIGSAFGLLASVVYGQAMLNLLRSWWPPQMSGIALHARVSPASLAIGFAVNVVVALIAISLGVRSMTRMSAVSLLAGAVRTGPLAFTHPWRSLFIAVAGFILAVALAGAAYLRWLAPTLAFFGSGTAMLVAGIAAARYGLLARSGFGKAAQRSAPLIRLGIRNAARHPGRSTLTIALVASATFIVVAVGASRREHGHDPSDRRSGTGGFALVAESTIPILQPIVPPSSNAHVYACRLRPGDDASCLNLYRPRSPKIVGVPDSLIRRGGFAWASTLAGTPEERVNPWLLLNWRPANGAVPAIADESTVVWLLKSGLGRDVAITDERGNTVPLRFVGLLAGSMLQSEIIIAEESFKQLFPSIAGYGFFLVESEPGHSKELARSLEGDFSEYGLAVRTAVERLSAYAAVENTYLSAFQLLGGLGIVLGTFGLATVLARNVLEQRRELALLEAVGFRRGQIRTLLLAENLALLLFGLAAGAAAAMVAVLPHRPAGTMGTVWGGLAGLIAAIIAAGALSGWAAVKLALRGPLVRALRNE